MNNTNNLRNLLVKLVLIYLMVLNYKVIKKYKIYYNQNSWI
jgi:hypothetical protein